MMPSNRGRSESAQVGNCADASRHQTTKSSKPTDQAHTYKHGGAKQNRNDGHLAPLKFSGNRQMQHYKNEGKEAEDVVKYMSDLPCYLQRAQKDAIQGNALNFGVLNWGHLERWNHKQKRATVGRTVVHSPSSSDSSKSSFSSFGSSTASCRSDCDSCSLTQRKQFPSSNLNLNSSNEEGHSQVLDEKHSKRNIAFSNLRNVPVKNQFSGRDRSGLIDDAQKNKESDSRVIRYRTNQAPKLETLCSNSTVAVNEDMEAPDDKSRASDDDRPTELNRKSFSEDLCFQFATSSPHVPHSCPLPCSSLSGEWRANEIASPVDAPGVGISPKLESIPDSGQTTKTKSKGKDSARHYGSASFDIAQKDKGNGFRRGKAGQLRKILDPLLKHKVLNNVQFTGIHESVPTWKPPSLELPSSTRGPHNSSKASSNFVTSQPAKRNQKSLSWLSLDKLGSLQDDKPASTSMHALLKLGCKNGLPLFTFTYNDTEILAATMRKVDIPGKNYFNCIYTFYSVQIVRKKSEGRINQESNIKAQDYHSNIIGRMKVTCCPKSTCSKSKDHVVMREFVLTSAEKRSAADEALDLPPNCELAAIIIDVRNETMDCLNGSGPNGYDYGKTDETLNKDFPFEENCNYGAQNLQTRSSVENQRFPSILAILPSGVHGFPCADGVPSPLIDRWKYGGSCDCGGWDVGCALTILADQDQPRKSFSSCQARCNLNNTNQVDLLIQGGAHENKHVFSLVAFKEGEYMVDFNASISLLQVFSICVAILHNRKPVKQSEVFNQLDDRMKTVNKAHVDTPSSYVPDPPLSPVGRV